MHVRGPRQVDVELMDGVERVGVKGVAHVIINHTSTLACFCAGFCEACTRRGHYTLRAVELATHGQKRRLTSMGLEPTTFGFGIRCPTIGPRSPNLMGRFPTHTS